MAVDTTGELDVQKIVRINDSNTHPASKNLSIAPVSALGAPAVAALRRIYKSPG
jgi:hypothetical protein